MRCLLALLGSLPLATAVAQAPSSASRAALFQVGHVEVSGHRYAFRLLEPLPHLRACPQPLVVFLHGAGERGDDNEAQCQLLPQWLAEPAQREAFPCFVLALQCPRDEQWVDVAWSGERNSAAAPRPTRAAAAVLQAIDVVLLQPGLDSARVYLSGVSMGGFGAIDLAMREPDRFAGLLAVCGGGDPAGLRRLVGLPTQLWHGADDQLVPPQRSRELAAIGKHIGAPIDYYEIEGAGHDVWRQAYGSSALAWLFAQDQRQQRRGAFARPACLPSLDGEQLANGWFALQRGARCFAAAEARTAAGLFLAELPAAIGLRPGMTAGGVPAAGDVVFRLDGALADAFVITVADQFDVVARDARCLGAAAAAATQLLCTGPRGTCPRGRFRRAAVAGGCIGLPAGEEWSATALHTAVRASWWIGADELVLPSSRSLTLLDAPAQTALATLAGRYGVALTLPGQRRSRAAEQLLAGGTARELLLLPGVGGGALPFVFHVPAAPPAQALASLPWLAAAAAERAARRDAIHVAEFWSRLGHLQR